VDERGKTRIESSGSTGRTVVFSPRTRSFDVCLNACALPRPGSTPSTTPQQSHWDSLVRAVGQASQQRVWCVFILRSGRFAGAIFDGPTLVAHRVLRRYTVLCYTILYYTILCYTRLDCAML
jgi:hypothetical protein